MNWQKLYNPMVISLLHSPLHRLLDERTMAITITGRKSGKLSTFPVSYVRDGETLLVMSRRERSWWKNLRGGAPVTIFLQGHLWQARGETLTDTELGASILRQILQDVPAYQRLLHVTLDATGQPENPEALARLARDHIVVRLRELTEKNHPSSVREPVRRS